MLYSPSHGENAGSNPAGTAKKLKGISEETGIPFRFLLIFPPLFPPSRFIPLAIPGSVSSPPFRAFCSSLEGVKDGPSYDRFGILSDRQSGRVSAAGISPRVLC